MILSGLALFKENSRLELGWSTTTQRLESSEGLRRRTDKNQPVSEGLQKRMDKINPLPVPGSVLTENSKN